MSPDELPLSDYALIGDCRTAALVGRGGRIDWWCEPRFDSPSVFGRLLDPEAGHFTVRAEGEATMRYEPGTNVLVHEWRDVECVDFLPWPRVTDRSRIVRLVRALARDAVVHVEFEPRADYGAALGGVALFGAEPGALRLRAGESRALVCVSAAGDARDADPRAAPAWLARTRDAWRAWTARGQRYQGPHRELVERSLLALKLLTFEPTGAIVAAPTASLPEVVGGERNWDYRYAWIRDTGFAAAAFHRSGHEEEAVALARWVLGALGTPGDLQVLYAVDHALCPPERALSLRGRLDSRPVRVGNGARDQFQLDAFGHLMDCLHLSGALERPEHRELWHRVVALLDRLRARWRDDDNGIWEVPAGPRPFVYSKVMAWAAFDRALREADRLGLPCPREGWSRARDEIRDAVLSRGVDRERGVFVQSFGSRALDAALLRVPLVGFLPPDDARVVATRDAVQRALARGDLVLRYASDDGLPGEEGAFLPCSFWLVEALAIGGRREEAARLFERLRDRLSPLGLAPEEASLAREGELLGNYPQAFTHAALVMAAWDLEAPKTRATRDPASASPRSS